MNGRSDAYLSARVHAHQICFRACSSVGENRLRSLICHLSASRWSPRSYAYTRREPRSIEPRPALGLTIRMAIPARSREANMSGRDRTDTDPKNYPPTYSQPCSVEPGESARSVDKRRRADEENHATHRGRSPGARGAATLGTSTAASNGTRDLN